MYLYDGQVFNATATIDCKNTNTVIVNYCCEGVDDGDKCNGENYQCDNDKVIIVDD